MTDQQRPPPHSRDAERIVLGGLMLDQDKMGVVSQILTPEHFYFDAHARLYQLLLDLEESGKPTEMMSVIEHIGQTLRPEVYGGLGYISSLPDKVPSTENLEHYANTVRDLKVRRLLIDDTHQILDKAFAGGTVEDLTDFAESRVFALKQSQRRTDWVSLKDAVGDQFNALQKRCETAGKITGIPTGYTDLDKILAGLQPTDLIVLAARPSMGKTALGLNIAQNVAEKNQAVGFVSLEMSKSQLITRLMCSIGRVDASKVRTGYLSRDRDWPQLTKAAEKLHGLPLYVDDSPGLTIGQIRSKARRLKSQSPDLKLLVVDYIGLITGDGRVSREQQVSQASRGLKSLAKELNIAVLALSQLNREVEHRNNKRPVLSDLRESGAIEQDADVIMFIYRDEYYNKEGTPEPGVAEINVAKQRNGPTGVVRLAFMSQHTRFESLAEDVQGGYY